MGGVGGGAGGVVPPDQQRGRRAEADAQAEQHRRADRQADQMAHPHQREGQAEIDAGRRGSDAEPGGGLGGGAALRSTR